MITQPNLITFWLRWLSDYKAGKAPPAPDHYQGPNRKLNGEVWIHCSASDNHKHDDIEVIRRWHKQRGWRDIGYHYFITKAAKIQPGRSLELDPAAQKGHNKGTIAICVSGKFKFNDSQFHALNELCEEIERESGMMRFREHNEVSNKLCPVFDTHEVLGTNELGYRMLS